MRDNSQPFARFWRIYPQECQGLASFQARLGHVFRHSELLMEALTHRSAIGDWIRKESDFQTLACNERLEFLGDSVLGLSITTLLWQEGAEGRGEGEMSRWRSMLVNQARLAALALDLKLETVLVLGRGEIKQAGKEKASLLCDALEAVFGAVYLDAGYQRASEVIWDLFRPLLPLLQSTEEADFKSVLQEKSQQYLKETPVYTLLRSWGPDHSKMFHVRVQLRGVDLGEGIGPSKRQASQEAARQALASQETLLGQLLKGQQL